MTWFDYGVLTVLGVSLLVGVLRGFMREIISLAGWVAAFVLAAVFSDTVAGYMPASLGPMLSGLLAFLLVFIAVLVAGGIVGLAVSLMVRAAGMGFADRFLGAVFGAGRGIAVTLFAVLLAGLTPLPGESFWRQAVLAGPFETAALALRPYLPNGMAQRLKYRSTGS
jgi:membrane protein required for colicin V production